MPDPSLADLTARVAALEAILRRKTRLGDFTFGGNLSAGTIDSGTWTPDFAGSGTAGTFTYSVQAGRYQKIGKLVYITLRLTITAIGTPPTDNLTITGLPFTVANVTNIRHALSISAYQNFNLDANVVQLGAHAFTNTTRIDLFQSFDNAAATNFPASGLGATGDIIISGCYIAA